MISTGNWNSLFPDLLHQRSEARFRIQKVIQTLNHIEATEIMVVEEEEEEVIIYGQSHPKHTYLGVHPYFSGAEPRSLYACLGIISTLGVYTDTQFTTWEIPERYLNKESGALGPNASKCA